VSDVTTDIGDLLSMRDRQLGAITARRRRSTMGEKGLETGGGAQGGATAAGGGGDGGGQMAPGDGGGGALIDKLGGPAGGGGSGDPGGGLLGDALLPVTLPIEGVKKLLGL
jgi:hypothetical protein